MNSNILPKNKNINSSEIKSKNSELEEIMLTDLFGVVVNGTAILYNGVI